jgi:UDP-N-acetylmuramate: L-alanyl-gamma-D-glutamyl-meso-diaminopimelate ligase
MKLGTMKGRLAESLAGAERVFCYAGKGVGWDTAEALAPLGDKVRNYHGNLEQLVSDVVREALQGDVILCMSNGSFGGVHGKILAALKKESR